MDGKQSFQIILIALVIMFLPQIAGAVHPHDPHDWTVEEIRILKSLALDALPPLPPSPSNRVADHPRAVALGKKIFFDKRFSGNLKVSCATCHRKDMVFTDDLPLAHGMGTTNRRSMPLAGTAYSPWFFWDGRKDSLWSQALGPIENPVEHGISRTLSTKLIYRYYKKEYEEIFGKLPEFFESTYSDLARPAKDNPEAQAAWDDIPPERRQVINNMYADMGKSIAAYVRRILPEEAPFDRYVRAVAAHDGSKMEKIFTALQAEGLRLFITRAKCINCHNGPLLSNFDFHNIGVPQPEKLGNDRGRADGITEVLADPFNCLGSYSDADKDDCSELRFMDTDTDKYIRTFKTPSLRNVADRPPYMHAGQFATLREVLTHYATVKPGGHISPELEHRDLKAGELKAIEAFLHTLSGPIASP